MDEVNESNKKLREIVKKSVAEDENTQLPAIENITGTQSLRDTLALVKRSKKFFQNRRKINCRCFLDWCFYSSTWRKWN